MLGSSPAPALPWSVDPASASWLRGADFLTWTAGAALCLANEDEAAVLGDALAGAYPEVVVKRGAAGATLLGGESVPAAPADVVDLTGAGDAFAAGFLAAQLRGEDRLALAVATAARAVAVTGGRPGSGLRKCDRSRDAGLRSRRSDRPSANPRSFTDGTSEMPQHSVGELRRRRRRGQDEVGRAAQQRLDLRDVGEHLRELRSSLP